MKDPFGRLITYVRVSVTDRCNLKCIYCIPDGMEWVERTEILSFDEPDQYFLARVPVPGITEHDRGAMVQVQRAGHLVRPVGP